MSPAWRWRRPTNERPTGEPAWVGARPPAIQRALERALARPSGGWYVLDATRRIPRRPRAFTVAGQHLVAWREGRELRVAPETCPHMGASLAGACVREGAVVCPWHGLELGSAGHGVWKRQLPHDDGVLAWVRLDGATLTDEPILAARPERYIEGVIRIEARCEAQDVIANRLDPWHGEFYHPDSFGALEVLDHDEDRLTVRVEKLVLGRVRVEVDATFHSPEPRTIVMTIVGGEGTGSVVETHATPLEAGRSAVVEATLATSDRKGFRHALRLSRFVRPFIERSARRLWVEDAAYAERLAELRRRGWRAAGSDREAGADRDSSRSSAAGLHERDSAQVRA